MIGIGGIPIPVNGGVRAKQNWVYSIVDITCKPYAHSKLSGIRFFALNNVNKRRNYEIPIRNKV